MTKLSLKLMVIFAAAVAMTDGNAKLSTPANSVADKTAQTAEPLPLVEKFIEAFNRHDVDAMAALTDPGVQWLSVNGDKISVETSGQDALRGSMKSYFASIPTAKSKIERSMVAGHFVTVWERATWQAKSGEKSQSSLAVYELKEGKILRVWYYPVMK